MSLKKLHRAADAAADTVELHRAADAAGRRAAESCHDTSEESGFAFLKFPGNTPWGLWTKKYGLSIKSTRLRQVIMVNQYDTSMPRKIAYAHAYAAFLSEKGIKVCVKIDHGSPT